MKKLLVLAVSCIVVTGVFASCDEKEESSASLTPVKNESEQSEEIHETEPETEPEKREYIDADATAFIGKWECTEYTQGEEHIEDLMGMPIYALFQYEIKEDGTAFLPDALIDALADKGIEHSYSWGLLSENEIEIVDFDGSSILFTLEDDGRLSSVDGDETIWLEKVDNFKDFDFSAYYENMGYEESYVLTPIETDAGGNVVGTGETIIVDPSATETVPAE